MTLIPLSDSQDDDVSVVLHAIHEGTGTAEQEL